MQQNAAAFETWCLALHVVCKAEAVVLEWELPQDEGDPHYQRFLYRLRHFTSLFDWFSIGHPERLGASRLNPGSTLLLNAPAKRLGSDDLETEGEAALERACLRDPAFFEFFGCKRDGTEIVGRQLPVGVFESTVSKANAVFPGAKGAIDLYALKDDCFWLFELKAGANIPAGTLSEVFFYTCLMRDVCLGTIQPSHDDGRRIANAKRIDAWIVGHKLHPLLDRALSQVLSVLQAAIDTRWAGAPAVRIRSIALPGERDCFVVPTGKAD
ncbi:MAG: hypothetical protein HY854_14390 [Burkholderiales bacterium]|nr:hypothetical protein [Burkholderiales bacterium]